MPTPGLVFVTAEVHDPERNPDELFEHSKGTSHFALRYKNANPEAKRSFLWLSPQPDIEAGYPRDGKKFPEEVYARQALGNDDCLINTRIYEKIQTFEGYGHAERTGEERGQTLICVFMEPGESQEQEQDFEDWYRKQHLDMLSMCRGYRRTTRYKKLYGDKPRYLALHEYACKPDEVPSDQIKQVVATEWTQKILAEVKTYDRDVFELYSVQGDPKERL